MSFHANVLDGPGLPLFIELGQGGFDLAVRHGELWVRPVDRLPAALQARIQQHRDALVALVRICDAGVQERVEIFRAQLEASPGTVGPFLFKAGVLYSKGVCFSCGEGLPEPSFGRCWQCSLAWRLAYRLPVPAELVAACNEAKVVA